MNLSRRLRREALVWDGLFLATVIWIVFGALPLVAILIAALVTGDIPVRGEPIPDGFPAFSTPWWGLYPLTVLLAALVVASTPLPLRGSRAFSRGHLAVLCLLTLAATTWQLGIVTVAEGSSRGLDILMLIQTVLLVAVVARIVLGRLMPLSWREYVDDEGRVVPPRSVVRSDPPRPWSGRLPVRRKRS